MTAVVAATTAIVPENDNMQPITLTPSSDGTALDLAQGASSVELSASDVDRLIHDLATLRAKMTPIHPAEPPSDLARLHQGDNLLWSVKALPQKSVIQFAIQHPGLGWMAMWLSRAQVEDLQTSFEFELVKVPSAN
jgi:hypothetical protein